MPDYLQGEEKGKKIILASDFPKNTIQANQEWSNIFKNVRKQNRNHRFYIQPKCPSNIKAIQKLLNFQKLKEN